MTISVWSKEYNRHKRTIRKMEVKGKLDGHKNIPLVYTQVIN